MTGASSVSSDRAVRLLLFTARILVVALRDLLLFALPLDVFSRSISVRLMSVRALVPA